MHSTILAGQWPSRAMALAGNGPAGNGPAGNGPAGNGPAGNGPAGNGPAGNGPAGNGPAGNGPVVWRAMAPRCGRQWPAGNGPAGNGHGAMATGMAIGNAHGKCTWEMHMVFSTLPKCYNSEW